MMFEHDVEEDVEHSISARCSSSGNEVDSFLDLIGRYAIRSRPSFPGTLKQIASIPCHPPGVCHDYHDCVAMSRPISNVPIQWPLHKRMPAREHSSCCSTVWLATETSSKAHIPWLEIHEEDSHRVGLRMKRQQASTIDDPNMPYKGDDSPPTRPHRTVLGASQKVSVLSNPSLKCASVF